MSGEINLDRFRLPSDRPIFSRERPRRPVSKKGEPFLKGPVPMAWLREASSLPGKALHVAVEIWFQVGLKRSGEVALSLSQFKKSGISRSTASRGLAQLEEAGLVVVKRAPGRKPIVMVLPGPDASSKLGLSDEQE